MGKKVVLLASYAAFGEKLSDIEKLAQELFSKHYHQDRYFVFGRGPGLKEVGQFLRPPYMFKAVIWYWHEKSLGEARQLFKHLIQHDKVSAWLVCQSKTE